MLLLLIASFVLTACGEHATPATHVPAATHDELRTASIDELQFNDMQLQSIASVLVARAHARRISTSSGRNKIEQLLSLEGQLGNSELAVSRVNKLADEMVMTDGTQWAKLRRRAQAAVESRQDEAGTRVRDLLTRWQRERLEIIFAYLSSNYSRRWIPSYEWERRFHDFVKERPLDAATWGWIVLQRYRMETRNEYGRANSELAYRYYLESTGLGDGREAHLIFSVPRIEIR